MLQMEGICTVATLLILSTWHIMAVSMVGLVWIASPSLLLPHRGGEEGCGGGRLTPLFGLPFLLLNHHNVLLRL